MKQFIAIVDWDGKTGRVVKFRDYDTEEEALAHVARAQKDNKWPLAFASRSPGGGWPALKVVRVGELTSEELPPVVISLTIEERLAAVEARLSALEGQ